MANSHNNVNIAVGVNIADVDFLTKLVLTKHAKRKCAVAVIDGEKNPTTSDENTIEITVAVDIS